MANESGRRTRRKRDPAIIAAWILGGLTVVGVVVGVLLTHVLGGSSTAQPTTTVSSPPVGDSTNLTPTSSPSGQTQACTDLTETASGLTSLAFSADGDYLVGGDSDGHIYLWNVGKQQIAAQFQDPASQGIRAMAFNPDGQFAALDANGHIYLYGHSLAATFTASGVTSPTFGTNAEYLAGANPNGQVSLCRVNDP